MRRVLRDNGLSITMFGLFLIFCVGQSIGGYKADNSDNEQHRQPPESYGEYLTSGAFVEATFENWESEFLQMGSYVVLTALLIQKGSPESRNPEGDRVNEDPSSPGVWSQSRSTPSIRLVIGRSSVRAPPQPGHHSATGIVQPTLACPTRDRASGHLGFLDPWAAVRLVAPPGRFGIGSPG